MYPYFRLMRMRLRHAFRSSRHLNITDEFLWSFRPMLGDLDVYPEMNNGRHFVMFDLARYNLAFSMGLFSYVRKHRLAFVVGGSSVRYRKRVRPFRKATVRSRLVGVDAKFFYFQQTIEQGGITCSSALIRAALRKKSGTATPVDVMSGLGYEMDLFMEPWAEKWASWDDERPWPEPLI